VDDVVFLVHEAYFEYVDHPSYRSLLPLALERPNVVVVRIFSKVYGLAGLCATSGGGAGCDPAVRAEVVARSAQLDAIVGKAGIERVNHGRPRRSGRGP